MECPHELWMRLEPVDGVCPHCSFEENKRLRAALAFYADPFKHGDGTAVPDFYSELDFGAKAAEALNT